MTRCGWCDIYPPGAHPSCDRCRLGCDHSKCGNPAVERDSRPQRETMDTLHTQRGPVSVGAEADPLTTFLNTAERG